MNALINTSANCVILFAGIAMMLFVFGRHNPKLAARPLLERLALRASLVTLCWSALGNVASRSSPIASEVGINVSFAAMLLWAAWFHYLLPKMRHI
jgi:hypothetical protein